MKMLDGFQLFERNMVKNGPNTPKNVQSSERDQNQFLI